jgi:hypothetical protein
MCPSELPNAGCLSWRIPKAVSGKSQEQLVSLEHPTEIIVLWVPASVAEICGSHRGWDPSSMPDAQVFSNTCTLPWLYQPLTVNLGETVCTILSLFLTQKHCHTRPAFADESPLVDSPLCPKTVSQHTGLAWADVEYDVPYFLECHISFRWSRTNSCNATNWPYLTLLMETWDWMTQYSLNVIVEWLALPLRIREVPGSNLGPETGCPDWGFSRFSSVTPGKCRDSTSN